MPRLQRGSHADRGDDLYETPPEAVRALLAAEALPHDVWEPCAGRGAIARVLTAAGHRVLSTDLVAYDGADPGILAPVDFLKLAAAPAGFECLVTNPPFKHADEIVRHGLVLVPRVIVLWRLAALEGAARADLIDRHLHHVWLGIERLPMMHREGWEGRRQARVGAPFAWFVFEREPRVASAFLVERISWRAHA